MIQSPKRMMLNKNEQTNAFFVSTASHVPAVNTVERVDFLSEYCRSVLQVQGYSAREVPLDSAGDAKAFIETSSITYLGK